MSTNEKFNELVRSARKLKVSPSGISFSFDELTVATGIIESDKNIVKPTEEVSLICQLCDTIMYYKDGERICPYCGENNDNRE